MLRNWRGCRPRSCGRRSAGHDDEYLQSLRAELWEENAAFRDLWEQGAVGAWRSAVKRLRHPSRGWLTFDTEVLHDHERDHWVMLYTPRDTA
ncbi:hypothetical protein [Plantactinospora sp. KLBMP9567]|uniref:MmyB family transcriptional regulator n=1 Tax=Plantactinospora sp. KLBMP9567 TaxID=3085900 RepID=UPI003990A649